MTTIDHTQPKTSEAHDMATPTDPGPFGASFGGLFRDLKDETVTLAKQEIALARTETSENISQAIKDAVKVPVGGLVAYLGIALVLVGLSLLIGYGLVELGVALSLAHFIGFTVVGLIVGIIGYAMTKSATERLMNDDLKPTQTIESVKETTQWVKGKTS